MGSKLRFFGLNSWIVMLGIFLAGSVTPFVAAQPASKAPRSVNAITLSVNPNPAKIKQKVTLVATVKTNGKLATGGTVTFWDRKLQMGSMQVVGKKPAKGYATGTATLTTIVAPGQHSIVAEYEGVAKSPQVVRSKIVALKVTGKAGSVTALTAAANAQHPNNYDFTATVGGFGFAAPLGAVDLTDTTTGTDLGKAPLSAKPVTHGYAKARVIDAAGAPVQSVVADFNGDGFPDVATTNAVFGPSTMAVFLGKADGTFQKPVSYPAAYFASGILAGDFNNDGIVDLAAMAQGDSGADGEVDLYLGNGDGTFATALKYIFNGFPVAIAPGDFNRDGILDFATADYFANVAYVSIGNGDGTFQPPVSYPVGSGPFYIASADFNGDGYMDLTVVNDNVNTVSVLIGKKDGTFKPQQVYAVGLQVEFVATGDLNLDGKPDIVVANFAEQNVGVLIGNGDGTFQDQVTYSVGGNDSGIAIGDLNGDGKPDLAVSYYHPEKIGVLLGKGDGTFGKVHDYSTGQTQGYEVSVADLNGDGTPDIISSDLHASISVLLNTTTTKATWTDVAVPGTTKDTEVIVGKYGGNSTYGSSKSAPIKVKGSGGN